MRMLKQRYGELHTVRNWGLLPTHPAHLQNLTHIQTLLSASTGNTEAPPHQQQQSPSIWPPYFHTPSYPFLVNALKSVGFLLHIAFHLFHRYKSIFISVYFLIVYNFSDDFSFAHEIIQIYIERVRRIYSILNFHVMNCFWLSPCYFLVVMNHSCKWSLYNRI